MKHQKDFYGINEGRGQERSNQERSNQERSNQDRNQQASGYQARVNREKWSDENWNNKDWPAKNLNEQSWSEDDHNNLRKVQQRQEAERTVQTAMMLREAIVKCDEILRYKQLIALNQSQEEAAMAIDRLQVSNTIGRVTKEVH